MFKKISTKVWAIIIVAAVLVVALFLTCLITALISDEGRLKYELSDDGQYYSVVDIKNAYRGGWFAKETLEIPATHRGRPVKEIRLIKNLQKTKTVIIPDSVTTIGASAFFECSITSIEIPDSVTKIGNSAFENCTSLTKITLPSRLTTISGAMFSSCSSLTEIDLPDTVTTIGQGAFSDCVALQKIDLPSALTKIEKEAFSDCTSLTTITLPSRLNAIGDNAFNNCYSLLEICNDSTLSLSVGSSHNGKIAQNALNIYSSTEGASKLDQTDDGNVFYTGNEQIQFVKHYGFETQITLPAYYNGQNYQIYQYAFYGNTHVEEVVIPAGVTEIGLRSFRNCSALTKVTIGDSVVSIGDEAFRSCKKLAEVEFGNSIQTIGYGAFFECTTLQTLALKDGIQTIGAEAFSACTSLRTVVIGKGLQEIGKEAFYNCALFTELQFGGTKAEWETVKLGEQWTWDNDATKRVPSCEKVICSDGTIDLTEATE